jgi:hypothetical protein
MNARSQKPWTKALATAGAVPPAVYVFFIASEAVRCGGAGTLFWTIIGFYWLMALIPFALVAAAIVVWAWPARRFSLRTWVVGSATLGALGAALAIATMVGSRTDPTFCSLSIRNFA